MRAGEMAQRVMVWLATPEDLGLISRLHMWENRAHLYELFFDLRVYPCTHTK